MDYVLDYMDNSDYLNDKNKIIDILDVLFNELSDLYHRLDWEFFSDAVKNKTSFDAYHNDRLSEIQLHLDIAEFLSEFRGVILKAHESDLIEDYHNVVIYIDHIMQMSHHGGPLLEYSQEDFGDLDYDLDEKVFQNLSGLKYDDRYQNSFPLSDVVYSKWGEKFPELAEQSGALPEEAEGYNLRSRNWDKQDRVDIKMKLGNLSSIVRDIADITSKYPDMKQEEINRLAFTKDWVHSRILQLLKQHSIYPDELLDLISSDINKYGYLYIAFPESINRIVDAMLDGDDSALKILRSMSPVPVALRDVLKSFNGFIKSPTVDLRDIMRFLQVFDDLDEADIESIGFFLYRHPEFSDLFRVRLSNLNWDYVQGIIDRFDRVDNSREACIKASDILLRNSLLER